MGHLFLIFLGDPGRVVRKVERGEKSKLMSDGLGGSGLGFGPWARVQDLLGV